MTTLIKPAGEVEMVHVYRVHPNIAVIQSHIKHHESCDFHVQSTAVADRNGIPFAGMMVLNHSIVEEVKVSTKCHGSPSDSS